MKPTLAKPYNDQPPAGLLMSEKLDGVRAIWDGKQFLSRSGKVFPAPASILCSMPKDTILDGELFAGRGQFQKSVGKIRKGEWDGIEYIIFDAITHGNYHSRIASINQKHLPPFAKILQQTPCKDPQHLDEFENAILKLGGEGVMLRDASAPYEHKRTAALLKLKRFKTDEAIVHQYQDGNGKHEGRLGALIVKYAGKIFKIGTGLSDAERETPPPIGATVTFSYFELTDGGIPRFPVFIATRNYE